MAGFTIPPSPPAYQDSGQGASDRIASWMAWTADPNPLPAPCQTVIIREDNNGAMVPGGAAPEGGPPLPVGTGGCGQWRPMLDGSSTGATSGGDNAFLADV